MYLAEPKKQTVYLTKQKKNEIARYMAEETIDYKAGILDVLQLFGVPNYERYEISKMATEIRQRNKEIRAAKGIY